MKRNAPYLIILVLFLTAVFLGFEIYSSLFNPDLSLFKKFSLEKMTPIPAGEKESEGSETTFLIQARLSQLSQEDNLKLMTILQKRAKSGNTVTVSENCLVNPFVLKLENDKNIIIRNNDNVSHTLTFINQTATVSAGEKSEIRTPELNSGSIIRYGCDKQPSGYLIKD